VKKFSIFFLLIIIAFAFLNILYGWIISSVDLEFGKAKEVSQFKDKEFKILVFGNSTALDGVNADLLSKQFGESYNFAIGGASLEANFIQLKNYLNDNNAPDRVLFFLSSCHVNYKKLVAVNPIIENEKPYFNYGLKDIPLYKFRWLFIENVKKIISKDHRLATLVKGQLQISRSVTDVTNYQSSKECLSSENYKGDEFKYLWRMQALCMEQGIKFQIFEMPCWRKSQNGCSNLLVEGSLGDSLTIFNLNNYSMCDSLINPASDWLSENHLNVNGSIKITQEIARLIMEGIKKQKNDPSN
jgi:hypothetical protein